MGSVYNSAASLPIGSRTLNLNSVVYVVDGEFNPQYPTREIRRNDINGDRSDFQLRTEPATLSVSLQVPNISVTRPLLGEIANIDSVNWVTTQVTARERQGDFWLYDVSLTTTGLPNG
jgi:hypothetical protein